MGWMDGWIDGWMLLLFWVFFNGVFRQMIPLGLCIATATEQLGLEIDE
jgi:hypothetical protein